MDIDIPLSINFIIIRLISIRSESVPFKIVRAVHLNDNPYTLPTICASIYYQL